ncbi:hypothetical protein, partial [Staphylococcus aureus]
MTLSRAATLLATLLIALPAAAQEATPTAPAEPVPLFQAACVSGAVRLSKNVAEPITFAALPAAAQRAPGARRDGAGAARTLRGGGRRGEGGRLGGRLAPPRRTADTGGRAQRHRPRRSGPRRGLRGGGEGEGPG